jgi:hypothetical protein
VLIVANVLQSQSTSSKSLRASVAFSLTSTCEVLSYVCRNSLTTLSMINSTAISLRLLAAFLMTVIASIATARAGDQRA